MLQNKLMRTILMGALVATLMVLALPSPAFAAPRVIVGVYGGYGPYWGPWGGWGYPGYGYYGGRSLGAWGASPISVCAPVKPSRRSDSTTRQPARPAPTTMT